MPITDSKIPAVDVVVVSWNSMKILDSCINSVFSSRAIEFRFGKTVVVDNASVDGSADWIAGRFGTLVTLLRNVRNQGFGKACNAGSTVGSARYILFLNPDAELGEESVEHAVRFLEDPRNGDVGVCGVRLVDRAGVSARTCARRPTALMFLASAFGLHRFIDSAVLSYVMTDFDHESDRAVDHVMGAMYLVRRSVFEQLGGFDERFFVYLEDLDLSIRIRDGGHRIVFLSNHPVFHEGGGTSKSVLDKRLFYALDSRLKYAKKHFSMGGAAVVWLSTLVIEPLVRTGVAVSAGRISSVPHIFRAYRWLYGTVLGVTSAIEVSGYVPQA